MFQFKTTKTIGGHYLTLNIRYINPTWLTSMVVGGGWTFFNKFLETMADFDAIGYVWVGTNRAVVPVHSPHSYI